MTIKVLGSGCPKCKTLERKTKDALTELGIDAVISKVDDIIKIMEYGILHTPGLVINEKVVISGRLPSTDEIKILITQNL